MAHVPAFAKVLTEARAAAKQPVPALPDELYLDYSKTGNRDRGQRVLSARSTRLFTLTVAEGLEAQGKFVRPLTEIIEAGSTAGPGLIAEDLPEALPPVYRALLA